MPVNGAMPEEILVENGWIVRRPNEEYVLMLDTRPEDWGGRCRVEVSDMTIRLIVAGRTRAHLRRIDPRVTTAIRQQHHLKCIVGCDVMAPVLNACEIVGCSQAAAE